ncbi:MULTISPECIES: hypothetical protein [Spirulina sp. CCY15215]|uniref:hypothetical protein n=1 Tax=Spirulina sp. CCY15215 TaxID=2767591 RepID=UPI0019515DB7|nr:hypothetical protein [Spirulina major]
MSEVNNNQPKPKADSSPESSFGETSASDRSEMPSTDTDSSLGESQAARVFEQLPSSEEIFTNNPHTVNEADWFTLARKLRQRNRELLKKVATLEQALTQTREDLETEKRRSRQNSLPSSQPDPELFEAQAQIELLFQELEASHHVAQRQHSLIQTLTSQLEVAQTHIVRMERECALVRQRYEEQSQLLVQASDNSLQLRDRLSRQQEHTQQFKTVLDKYLSLPPASSQGKGLEASEVLPQFSEDPQGGAMPLRQGSATQGMLSPVPPLPKQVPFSGKPKPIQPWSLQFRNQQSEIGEPPSWVTRAMSQPSQELEFSQTAQPDPKELVSPAPQPPKYANKPPTMGLMNVSLPDFRTGKGSDRQSKGTISRLSAPTPPPAPTLHPRSQKKHRSLASVDLPSFPRLR